MEKIKENQVVLCKVKKIEGTTVFVEIKNNGQGSIIMSEVSAGRIRNLRDYVFPNKEIVCKVLKIRDKDHIELSLRRVTASEKQQVLDEYKKEKTFKNILKTVEKAPEEIIEKIKKAGHEIAEFYEQARETPEILKKFISKKNIDKISKILSEKRKKPKQIKRIIKIQSTSGKGLNEIKEILNEENVDISYLGSSKFSIKSTAKDFKKAEEIMEKAIKNIKEKSKKFNVKINMGK